jgi:hypothetical protein
MLVAADYPFLDIFWTMIVFFIWVAWIWIVIRTVIDVFRRRDAGGFKKALWVIFIVFAPFLGVLAYLIVNGHHMADRDVQQVQAQQAQFDSYVQSVAGGGAATEIAKAKELLDSGAITQAEFDQVKQKALAGS